MKFFLEELSVLKIRLRKKLEYMADILDRIVAIAAKIPAKYNFFSPNIL